jgi:glyoxylase-like metal-dependent hydrolase (beta-lactamase superfamily II)
MPVEFIVISIGALSRNRLWGETAATRTAHATTTVVFDGDRVILVDPSLPAAALGPVFNERTGKCLHDVTDVFCTTLRPVHRRSITALAHANWWVHEAELESYAEHLKGVLGSAERLADEQAAGLKADLKLLERFRPAPEAFSEQVTVYPLAGPSPGSAGLLLTPATATILIAGDAAVTAEHVRRGQVWDGCADIEQAMKAMTDYLELVDVIVPGHDNVMLVPGHWL